MQLRTLKLACAAVAATALSTTAGATDLSNSITGTVSDAAGALPYRLFEPQSVAAGQKVPLILFLHGIGDGGTDNVSQTYWMDNLQQTTLSGQYAAYVLAPQLAKGQWGASNTSTPTNGETLTMDALEQVLKSLPNNVDTSRIYITGVSMGSFETYDLLAKDPGTFAAAVPMSGAPSTDIAPQLTSTPIWAFHAADDPMVPVETTASMISAINADGGNAKFTELATGGHYIWPTIYSDPSMYSWLFDQKLDGEAAVDPVSAATLSAGFSSVTADPLVPEPASLSFLGLCAAALFRRKRRTAR